MPTILLTVQIILPNQPGIALVNGKYVVQWQKANSTVLTITNPVQPNNSVFCQFYNTNSSYATIITTQYDYEIRFGGSNGITVLGDQNNGDWFYCGSGTKISYINGVSNMGTFSLSTWTCLCYCVQTPTWSNSQTSNNSSSFNRIGTDGAVAGRSISMGICLN